jgi:hypothetical protein
MSRIVPKQIHTTNPLASTSAKYAPPDRPKLDLGSFAFGSARLEGFRGVLGLRGTLSDWTEVNVDLNPGSGVDNRFFISAKLPNGLGDGGRPHREEIATFAAGLGEFLKTAKPSTGPDADRSAAGLKGMTQMYNAMKVWLAETA